MSTVRNRIGGVLTGCVLALTCVAPALADDSEIYVNSNTGVAASRPNIMFIVDTSGSMSTPDVVGDREPYNASGPRYPTAGNCTGDNIIFFRAEGDPLPDCSSDNFIVRDTATNMCDKLRTAIVGLSGRWTGKTAQYDETSQTWRDLLPGQLDRPIECSADGSVHGSYGDATTTETYARNGDRTNRWSSDPAAEIDWSQRQTYTFYSSNWLNWRRTAPTTTLTRLTSVKQAVIDMAASIDGVNLGLMRYSNNGGRGEFRASGGYVAAPVVGIEQGRANLIATVNAYDSAGFTPLSETMWEAVQYFRGGAVDFGNTSRPGKSVAASRVGNDINSAQYQSPIIGQCQRNFIIYLTDGLPTRDQEVDGSIPGKPRATSLVGACKGPRRGADDPDDGLCLDDLAGWLNTNDLNSTLPGDQTVSTYVIGFGSEVKDTPLLNEVAAAGGGKRFDASTTEQLTEVLTMITNDVLNVSTTFTTASVGVNAFNRTQSRDELYFALFAPKETARWEGNLKKFKLAVDKSDPKKPKLIIVGQSSATVSAVDPTTGRFTDTSQSYWSDAVDGNVVERGGAARELPARAARKLYTYLGTNPAGAANVSLVPLSDDSVTDAILNTTTGTPTRDQLLRFAYAEDTKRMGDPLHSEPAIVTYGGTSTNPTDVVYVATNDGYLHAINPADNSGAEKWAFIPRELLPRLRVLYNNPNNPNRSYGLDGDIRILRLDRDGDGIIEAGDGDTVWLFVGMRRGGSYLYALNVTDPDNPKMLWIDGASDPNSLGYTVLPGLGETWSAPTITRVNVSGGAQNNQKLVLVFGGGYDSAQEGYTQVDDTVGNRVFMVDAKTGKLLWYAAPDASHAGADTGKLLTIPDMKNSIPSRVAVIDTNRDLFADRMYVGDMGGRLFRFDIFNEKGPKDLVTGGVMAELGQGQVVAPATPSIVNTRRFYNQPDVALVQRRGEDPYYNIAIGSGYRGHPLHRETVDRFYSIRDKAPFMKLTMDDYKNYARARDADLVDVTPNPMNAVVKPKDKGWMLKLGVTEGGSTGEKVLTQSTTADDTILFTTFEPRPPTATDPCRPQTLNRAYAVMVDNGRPALDLNGDGKIDNSDLSTQVPTDGVLGKVNVGLLRGKLADDLKSGENPPDGPPTVCLAGMQLLGTCVQVDDSVRTYWSKDLDSSN